MIIMVQFTTSETDHKVDLTAVKITAQSLFRQVQME